MKKNYLFSHQFRVIGWVLAIVSIAVFVAYPIWFPDWHIELPALYYDFPLLDDKDTSGFFVMAEASVFSLAAPVLTIGLLFIGFSKEKVEDEFVHYVRSQSLIWATYVTAALFILATLLIYGIPYIYVPYLLFFVFLILFIIKFRIALYKANKGGGQ